MEWNNNVETIFVGKNSIVNRIIVKDLITKNYTDKPMPFLVNNGHVKLLKLLNVETNGDEILINNNLIDSFII